MTHRIGIGTVTILVILGVLFGAIAGAVVGAVTVAANSGSSHPTPSVQLLPSSNQAAQTLIPVTNAVAAVKRVGPAVVEIQHGLAAQTNPLSPFPQSGGTVIGSGFIVDSRGDIVTNAHVISGASRYHVTFANGRHASATLVGKDTLNDIAVIRVNSPVPAVAQFGNSARLQLAEPVLAIGDALGVYRNTVTEGIVSGLNRPSPGEALAASNMIQTDAAINHGNSGGPLIDLTGHVVGINTEIQRSTGTSSDNLFGVADPNATVAEGLGFAIPSNTAAYVAQRLIAHVPPPYMGIQYLSQTKPVRGAFVQATKPGSPAQRAGLQTGDVIVAINGKPLRHPNALMQRIEPYHPGQTIQLRVWRQGKTRSVSLTLGAAP